MAVVRQLMSAVCAAVTIIIILVTLAIISRTGKELIVVENAISSLSEFDLYADKELEKFYGRKDEIGLIAEAAHNVCSHLRTVLEDIERILNEIADGNLTVDVEINERYYIGDLKMLTGTLKTIRSKLTKVLKEISDVSSHVNEEANQVSSRAESLSHGARNQALSIHALSDAVENIEQQADTTAKYAELAENENIQSHRNVQQ